MRKISLSNFTHLNKIKWRIFIPVQKAWYVKKIARGGWSGFGKALTWDPSQMITCHPKQIPKFLLKGGVVQFCPFFHPKTPGKECFGFQTYLSGKSTSLYKLAWGKSSCVFVKILKYIYIVHQMNHTCVCAKTLRWEKQMLPGVFSMAVARMLCLSIMFAIGQLDNRTIR